MDQPLWKNLKFLTFSTSCFHSLRRFFVLENTFFCPTFLKQKEKMATLVPTCKEAGWSKARGSKIKCKPDKTNGSIRKAKQKKKTCNPLGRTFLITLIMQNWDNYCETKRRGSNNSENFSVNSHLLKFVSLRNDLCTDLKLLSNHADDTLLIAVIIALHYHCYKF